MYVSTTYLATLRPAGCLNALLRSNAISLSSCIEVEGVPEDISLRERDLQESRRVVRDAPPEGLTYGLRCLA
jgi:hypothetical protein